MICKKSKRIDLTELNSRVDYNAISVSKNTQLIKDLQITVQELKMEVVRQSEELFELKNPPKFQYGDMVMVRLLHAEDQKWVMGKVLSWSIWSDSDYGHSWDYTVDYLNGNLTIVNESKIKRIDPPKEKEPEEQVEEDYIKVMQDLHIETNMDDLKVKKISE